MIHFTLYSRSYCHLCDDMLAALHAFPILQPYVVKVVDVDAFPLLVAQYDELVPVLLGRHDSAPDRRLCHYFLDADRLQQFIASDPVAS